MTKFTKLISLHSLLLSDELILCFSGWHQESVPQLAVYVIGDGHKSCWRGRVGAAAPTAAGHGGAGILGCSSRIAVLDVVTTNQLRSHVNFITFVSHKHTDTSWQHWRRADSCRHPGLGCHMLHPRPHKKVHLCHARSPAWRRSQHHCGMGRHVAYQSFHIASTYVNTQ